jgi:sulfite exporter TauE/SafE
MSDKKTVVTTKSASSKPKPIVSSSSSENNSEWMVFSKQNYIYMGLGVVLIFLGLLLMSGGGMPSGEVWDESLIYSTRRTVIAPILILAGFVVEIYAIFKR